jgi:3-oxoacyl-[acyl-carrier protein] reductase
MAEIRLGDRTTDRRVALVTGASGIIGAAIARTLGSAGFRVAVHYYHGKQSAVEVVESIVAAGGEASAVEADLSRQESVAPMFDRIEQQFGPVDYLVNNAGINRDVLLAFMSEEQWDEVIDTNLRGTYLCSRLALPGMMRLGSGAICNIVSPAGVRGQAGQAITRRPKAALSLSPKHSLARWGSSTSEWTPFAQV